jgi:hypothetical protein
MCELAGFMIQCGGPMQRHHIINKSRLRGNARALRVVNEFWPEMFLADVCQNHNVSRWADAKQARAMLFQRRVDLYGAGTVRHALNLLGKTFKSMPADLTLEALL